ncbi:LLM class flavin-dependent oxidoreductase [Plantactinospora sp. KLBMP9567]|uniref:LLM class flavin-dependent oxidoreductase n=1 Tax=Plantactinospora sp. KLBMP9567 TaxID=3085900 RepID=UPI002980D0BF|nr:LLM class flavin-dependent oxidoreductase [Plantactinospora sp. KLBMP9567]MDW5322534.1 LLM class flavin-dependent oxidoreductase [Plantactinospora sp. KLBMP9567]
MTRFGWFLGHEEWQPEQLLAQARRAEQAGFDAVLVSDHLQPWVDDAGSAGHSWATLGAIATATRSATLVSAVACPLFRQHPVLVAQAAGTLDRLSGGRFHLGVGTGEGINEAPLGRFPPYPERLSRMTEALGLLRPLLAGKTVTQPDGAYYPVSSIRLHSPPLTGVPVHLAAAGPRSAATAGRLADGVISSVKDPERTGREVVDVARAAAAAAGRTPPRVVLSSFVVLADSDDDALRALRPWRGLRTPGRLVASSPIRLRQRADRLGRDAILARYRRVGKPRQLLGFCERLLDRLRPDVLALQVAATDGVAALEGFAGLVDRLRQRW